MSEQTAELCLTGGGEMGALMRAFDWSKSPVGAVAGWPPSLRTSVATLLATKHPMYIAWGDEFVAFYNDAYRPILGDKHPAALGQSTPVTFAEVWDNVGPLFHQVYKLGRGLWYEDMLVSLQRFGYLEDCYFTFSYSPLRSEAGDISGILAVCQETTQRVLSERRLSTLSNMALHLSQAQTPETACELALQTLDPVCDDCPFALCYLTDSTGRQANLAATFGLAPGTVLSPPSLPMDGNDEQARSSWPLAQACFQNKMVVVESFADRLGNVACTATEKCSNAVVLPIGRAGYALAAGAIVLGVSKRRAFDRAYRDFLWLVASHVATAVANARAHQEERKRADSLAALNVAKTTFFQNASHELRTPLTLMLAPIEATLNDTALPVDHKENLEMARRSCLRLTRLVNTILDFSAIEAGHVQAVPAPTDLAGLTIEVASMFRSAIEKAGLRFNVDCPPLAEPILVDADWWEKIIANLLSNAIKFTLRGEISLRLQKNGKTIQLDVADTGTGIAPEQQASIFDRFHRTKTPEARTMEGTGIGLALVRDLVQLQGGTVTVTSTLGKGSTFTVRFPAESAHLGKAEPPTAKPPPHELTGSAAYVEEAMGWLPPTGAQASGTNAWPATQQEAALPRTPASDTRTPALASARILIVDDNADMRQFLCRLLAQHWNVQAVADGKAALRLAMEQPPDLVLSDIMMPGLDGVQLLHELKSQEATAKIPVLLLTARAGTKAAVESLAAGADDYLVKPFSAPELVARVQAHLALARLQAERAERLAAERSQTDTLQILERITNGFFAVNREWRFTYVNSTAEELLQRSRHALVGRCLWDELPDAVSRKYYKLFERAMVENVTVEFEARYAASGKWLAVHAHPSESGISVYIHDVTQRRVAEAELDELFENCIIPISWVAHNGAIVRANDAELTLLGYHRQEYVGRPFSDFYVDAYVADELLQRVNRGDRVCDFPARLLAKDRRIVHVQITTSGRQADGLSSYTRFFARDVTQRIMSDSMLQRYSTHLDLLREVDRLILASTTSKEIAQSVLRRVRLALDCQMAQIQAFDWDALSVENLNEDEEEQVTEVLALSDLPHLDTLKQGQVYALDGLLTLNRSSPISRYIRRAGVRAWLSVPLFARGELIGCLNVGDDRLGHFTRERTELARAVAASLALALQQTQLHEHLERRFQELSAIAEVCQRLQELHTPATLAQTIIKVLQETLGYEYCAVLLVEADSEQLVPFAVSEQTRGLNFARSEADQFAKHALRLGAGVVGWVAQTGKALRVDNVNMYADNQALGDDAIQSELCMPIFAGKRVIGVLKVETPRPKAYSSSDERVLETVAAYIAVAIENARLYEQTKKISSQMQMLSQRLVEAQEAERRCVAHELHDEVGQTLTGLKFLIDLAARETRDFRLEEAGQLVTELMQRVHDLSLELRPSMLDDLGLLPSLVWLTRRVTAQTGIRVKLEHRGLPERFTPECEISAYRITQEALTNVARHAGVTEAAVLLWSAERTLYVQIEDSGHGFQPETVLSTNTTRIGLAGMRERANLLGGYVQVDSQPGAGTRITAALPIAPSQEP